MGIKIDQTNLFDYDKIIETKSAVGSFAVHLQFRGNIQYVSFTLFVIMFRK